MTHCREAEGLIERHLDGEVTEAQKLALMEHVTGCAACSELLQCEAEVDAGLAAAFRDKEPSPQLGPQVLRRLRVEASVERWGWIADALNAVGGLVMFAFAMRVLGSIDPRSGGMLLAIVGSAAAVSLYPLLLARLGGTEP
jgi:anti-sigma factor RsiW